MQDADVFKCVYKLQCNLHMCQRKVTLLSLFHEPKVFASLNHQNSKEQK